MTHSLFEPSVQSLSAFGFDGRKALESLIACSPYGTLVQAAASLAVFSHPDTVAATGCAPVVNIIRNSKLGKRGALVNIDGLNVGLDDNTAPTYVFCWCNQFMNSGRRYKDIQFNHIWGKTGGDVSSYTCLANICVTPIFLAKLTDDPNSDVSKAIKYRAYDLYKWHPNNESAPERPPGYGDLKWARPLEPVFNVIDSFAYECNRRDNWFTRLVSSVGTGFSKQNF